MTTITIDDISGKARDAGTSLTNALPPSVTDAGRKAYDSVAGGAQWYIEQWEDLIAEAREMRASAELDDIPAEDFLANLIEAKIDSDIPGRLRVRPAQLKGRSELARQCTELLAGVDGISEAHVSALTGSVLLFYDTNHFETSEELLLALG
ncbi:MAG: hypothetical protein M9918_18365 [Anaerolineae bacterium]|nr:hypothetical protein [Anaerolineae bacterium]